MVRSRYDYSQSAIGICGHVVGTWPQICDPGGHNPVVPCETCTRAQFDIPEDERLTVWVAIPTASTQIVETADKPKIKPKKRVKKEKPKTYMDELLTHAGFFNGT